MTSPNTRMGAATQGILQRQHFISLELHGSRVSQGRMSHPGTPLWVLLHRESQRDSTARPQKLEMQSFPQESKVTPVELSIKNAVSPLLNLEAAQQGRSVLFSDEQKLLFERRKKGFAQNTKLDFYELLTKPRMKAIQPGLGQTFHGHSMEESYAQYWTSTQECSVLHQYQQSCVKAMMW